MKKTFDITVDLENQTSNTAFSVSQNDLNSVKVNLTLTQDGSPVDLTDCSVRIAIRKPSRKVVYQDCTVIDPAAGTASVVLTTQAYVEIGSHLAEIVISKGDEVAVTGTFKYTSLSAILNDGALESNNDFQAIYDVINAIPDAPDPTDPIDAYTKAEVDTALAEVDTALTGKADTSSVYTKAEVDASLTGKANTSELDGKVPKVSAGNVSVQAGDFTYTFGLDSGMYAPIFVEGGVNLVNKYQAVTLIGTGSPVGMAWINRTGQMYIDTDSKSVWIAVGENAGTDWKKLL